jgi:predicted N-acyltransferase
MEIKLFNKIEEIPEKDWMSVFPDVPENYRFMRALDAANFTQFKFYYLMAYESGVPVGCAPLFLMDFPLDMNLRGFLKRITKSLRRVFPKLFSAKILFCGLISGRGRIGSKGKDHEVLDALVDHMENLASRVKARVIVFKDFDSSYSQLLQGLSRRGFRHMDSFPIAIMGIRFNSFEEYLKSLSAVSREGLRRKLRKLKDNPQFELEITNSISREVSAQMHDLYLQTVKNAEIEFEELPADYFSLVSESAPESNKCFLWRHEGRLIAFAQCLIEGDHFIDYYLGFDYSVSYKYNLYYVRFKELMEWCIANKMAVYEMGQSSYEIKRRLGFDFLPLHIYSRPCGRFILPLYNFFHRFLSFDKVDYNKKGK